LLIAILCVSTHAEYLKKNVYYEKDCSGAVAWTIYRENVCAQDGDVYTKTNCTSEGVYTLTCTNSDCTNCTSAPRTGCYPEGEGSSAYECASTIAPPQAGSFVEERYGGMGCSGSVTLNSIWLLYSRIRYIKGLCVQHYIDCKNVPRQWLLQCKLY
jgi:hypothetical protein